MDQKEIQEATAETQELAIIAARPIAAQADYDAAAAALKFAKAILKKIGDTFDPIIKAQNDALKVARDEKKRLTEPVEKYEGDIRKKAAAWITAQEEAKRAEERRRYEAARAEEARLRFEAEKQQEFLAEIGAAETVVAPVVLPVIPEPVAAVEQSGISYREVWRFEIVDAAAIPREYLSINEVAIGSAVRTQKGLTNIPGVRAYSEKAAIVR